jgi:pimeloyl-ACP methyl ester carboxylesterase
VGHTAESHHGPITDDQDALLILDGEGKGAIHPNQTKLMAELIPEAKLEIMPDTGHFALFEQPEEFGRIVLDFLAS